MKHFLFIQYDTSTMPMRGGLGVAIGGSKKLVFIPTKLSRSVSEDPSYDSPFMKQKSRSPSITGNPYDKPVSRQSALSDSLSGFPDDSSPKMSVHSNYSERNGYDFPQSTNYDSIKSKCGDSKCDQSIPFHNNVLQTEKSLNITGGGTVLSVGDDKKVLQ